MIKKKHKKKRERT